MTSSPPTTPTADRPDRGQSPRLLITAGPTHEPIDAVRYIGNRSSGRLGVALAAAAVRRGWPTTLLLGPHTVDPSDSRAAVRRFRSTADLEALLIEQLPHHDILVMAAAVADYRPKVCDENAKIRRSGGQMVLELESTPDLLAGCSERREPEQMLVGFALEPRDQLMESAGRKLERKGIDLIVANPLETMDAGGIEATLVGRAGTPHAGQWSTGGVIDKTAFADFLLDALTERFSAHIREFQRAQ